MKPTIEICFTPKLFPYIITENNYIVVIVDILRATTSICAAFDNNVKAIIPVASVEEALQKKKEGFLVAAERDGIKLDFADFGNSPSSFMKEEVRNKEIVYCTTNGTQAIEMTKHCESVVIGSFVNINAIVNWLIAQQKNVVILCSGWKGKFNLEDSVFGGALSYKLLNSEYFQTNCDSVHGAIDLWEKAQYDLFTYFQKASHLNRLKNMRLDDVLEYAFSIDIVDAIPVLKDDKLIDLNKKA